MLLNINDYHIMLQSLFITFGLLSLLSIWIVLFSRINLILKLTFLIFTFICIAFEYFILDLYFLGFTYIIVYVGAISILFLFVIMMTNNSLTPDFTYINNSDVPLLIIIYSLFCLFLFYFDISFSFFFEFFNFSYIKEFYSITDIENFGTIIYLAYPHIILIIAILLWCILIGILRISGL